ncbi:MgtC/SapB family protein [Flavobacterium sp. LS1P28]|uniref:MgtC/SapB family protein n=1 Tax=Flavobacterium bomense TaxID=2497483 RepID=A0A432CKT3_9FLAO|nr:MULTISPECIES: MgtC/SapB family protein [Flavobacterium]RTY78009.1 MgtC/SapB family protein [Flavobacterium sp. LS1P28]RTZ03607.1 MgtC/SapB family protein [Flavobacterium bomense]
MILSEFVMRLAVALIAGLSIGFERQWQHKSAGLRTNTLVAVGSALFVLLSIIITKNGGDVTRIIGQVVTGIGFLCAGIIFKEGLSVHGLTTASTVWCCSAIGSLAAAGYYSETAVATISILAINILLRPIDTWLTSRKEK